MSIVIKHLEKSFNNKKVLKGIDIEIQHGEIFGILGPNGAGKTTLIKCIVGLLNPDSGEVLINGEPPHSLKIKKIMGYVPEKPIYYPNMTAFEFLSYLGEVSGLPKNANSIKEILTEFGMIGFINQKIGSFSRGMLQKISIAQSLIHNPEIWLLDEPTTAIDSTGIQTLKEKILNFKNQNKLVVICSNKISEMENILDRIAYIEDGSIRFVENLNLREERFLIECNKMISIELINRKISQYKGINLISIEERGMELMVNDNRELIDFIKFLSDSGVVIDQVLKLKKIEKLFEK